MSWAGPKINLNGVSTIPAAVLLIPPLSTPPKPALFSSSPSHPHKRVLRKATKRRRPPGDLAKRRQSLVSSQLSHTPPTTPKPEQSPLERPTDNHSNQTNPYILYPPSPSPGLTHAHAQPGCPATWSNHPLPTVMAA